MITSVRIRNVSSIEDATICFEKGGYRYLEKYVLGERVSNPIAVYGANGSGKSSLLNAFASLVNLLSDEPDRLTGFTPCVLSPSSLSGMEISFCIGGRNFTYSILEKNGAISEESLREEGTTSVERKDSSYSYKGKTYPIESSLYPALRDIYASGRGDESELKAYEFLSNIAFVGASRHNYIVRAFRNRPSLDVLVEKSKDVKEIIRSYRVFPVYDIVSSSEGGKKSYYSILETGSSVKRLPLSMMSDGMQNQSFLLSILLSVPEGGVLVIDEIDQALHPLTIMDFINAAVERNIQLIFSGNNTNVLVHLRPDNILFADIKEGKSRYKRLSDIHPNIREINNIEKMYLSSTFDDEIRR